MVAFKYKTKSEFGYWITTHDGRNHVFEAPTREDAWERAEALWGEDWKPILSQKSRGVILDVWLWSYTDPHRGLILDLDNGEVLYRVPLSGVPYNVE